MKIASSEAFFSYISTVVLEFSSNESVSISLPPRRLRKFPSIIAGNWNRCFTMDLQIPNLFEFH